MSAQNIKVGLIGAGYIATWHADALRATKGVDLVAVCDVSANAADGFATGYGLQAFTAVSDMAGVVDAVHILTPPHLHHTIALECLRLGLHVLVEKPVALSAAETAEIEAAAQSAGKQFIAGHNFLGVPSYGRLKSMVEGGQLGRVSAAEINWNFPLAPLRSGPYGLWLLQEPRNLLLELGPHLMGFAVDLFGVPTITHLELGKPVALPGDDMRPQSWQIIGHAGDVALTFNVSLVETFDDRSVTVRGSTAEARLDYANDTLIVRRENASDLVVNPLRRELDQSWQHLREGVVNATRQLTSLNGKSPYGLSFRGTFAAVYDGIAKGQADARFAGATAVTVMQGLDDALALLPADMQTAKKHKTSRRKPKPTAMVIGGTGFIGRHLTRALVASGRDVRVLSRGKSGPFPDLSGHVELAQASLYDRDALVAAMDGIEVVYNLAKSMDKTWEDALKNDVGTAVNVAEAALEAGVKRLVYTGTIASYDMSDADQTITEDTGFPDDMSDRNMYARSKAECEKRLMQMYHERDLPLVIARPGIVVGAGGPLQHWGIGRWHGAGAVRIWGPGKNILPFVLIDDTCDALIRMGEDESAIGQSYNITGTPMMTARDYFDAIHQALGARIRVVPGNLHMFFASDAVKYGLKKYALRKQGVIRPSLADWKSRAHFSPFSNEKLRNELGWEPETNRDAFVQKAITDANLIGF